MMAEIIIIAALAKNNVIGKDGRIPWHIRDDFQHFKELTMGYPVIMGRKTYESLPETARPLPGRENIVITANQDYIPENGVVLKYSLEDALGYCKEKEKAYIIGGAGVYAQGMRYADKLELTFIDKEYDGDTFFPEIDYSIWDLINKEDHEGFSFNTFVRKK